MISGVSVAVKPPSLIRVELHITELVTMGISEEAACTMESVPSRSKSKCKSVLEETEKLLGEIMVDSSRVILLLFSFVAAI